MTTLSRITCVDDEPDLLELINITLTSIGGFEVTLFNNGPSALASIKKADPQLILLDGMMPCMSGMKVFSEIRKIEGLETTPIVFMTARIRKTERQEYLDLGAAGVIAKPFDPMTLSDEIRSIWSNPTHTNNGE